MNIIGKLKNKILVTVFIVLFVVGGLLSLKTSFMSEHPFVKTFLPPKTDLEFKSAKLHYYDNPNVSLERVHIQALFLVPRNSLKDIPASWKTDFEVALEQLKEFYVSQFGNSSELTFSILDVPAIAPDDILNSFPSGMEHPTETDLTPLDNFIENSVIKSGAPFYRKDFVDVPKDVFLVRIIFVEGPGAMGGEQTVILSRNYLTDKSIGYGATFLAHEFGHALGMPDLYTYDTGEVSSDDIMGSGRYRAINYVYFGDDIKRRMGIK